MNMHKKMLDPLERDKAHKEQIATDRAAMRKILTDAGIKKVTGSYEGYGDGGNSEVTGFLPERTLSSKDEEKLKDLIWTLAQSLNSGFENNDGGSGEFDWDVPSDRIDINHRFMMPEDELYENV